MTDVTLVATTASQAVPLGQTPDRFRFTITPAAGGVAHSQDVAALTAVFPAVDPGDYTASAVAIDTAGNPWSSPVIAAFTVPQPTPAQADAPNGMTVTLS